LVASICRVARVRWHRGGRESADLAGALGDPHTAARRKAGCQIRAGSPPRA
jgi:hypothetical protein